MTKNTARQGLGRPTPHDLRRTFRTRLSALGIPKDIRGRLMNHAPRDVGERHYDLWSFFPEKRAALLAWSECLKGILGNEATR
jgi:integrase